MKRIRHTAVVLTSALATACLLFAGAPAAFAVRVPPAGGDGPISGLAAASSGMPGWQIALIAIGAALAASAVTGFAQRLRFRTTMHAAAA